MAMALNDLAYNNVRVFNRMTSGLPKTFRWLIKPAHRVAFTSEYFSGRRFYDNGLLHLRKTITTGTVFTEANRPTYASLTHADLVAIFLVRVEENCLFQEQAKLANPDEGIQLVDPDGSLACILEHFMCPVCLDPCFPPSYVCPNSHILCGQCRNSLVKVLPEGVSAKCPICRIETQFEHSFTINGAIVGVLDFNCRYAVYGCKATASGAEILSHIANDCSFRPWRCYLCPEIAKVETFGEHLLSAHQSEIPVVMKELNLPASFKFEVPVAPPQESKKKNSPTVDRHSLQRHVFKTIRVCDVIVVRNCSTIAELIKLGCFYIKKEGFFFLLEMQLQYGSYGWAVSFLGPKKSCKRFVAEVTVKTEYDVGGSHPKEFVTDIFTNQSVLSMQEEMRKILENIRATEFPNGLAMKDFSRYGGAGRYHAVMDLEIGYAEQ